jgi:hypothetical protein
MSQCIYIYIYIYIHTRAHTIPLPHLVISKRFGTYYIVRVFSKLGSLESAVFNVIPIAVFVE